MRKAPIFLLNSVGALILAVLLASTITLLSQVALATTNISATTTAHWAWDDAIGWIDFYNTNTVIASSTKLFGYASSSVGDISLDCSSTRNNNICGTSSYWVTNDGIGNLSGYAWNDIYGWISFDCNNGGTTCSQSPYRVYIDSNGDFRNFAWNDAIGWISFNCTNNGCPPDYKVNSSWLGNTSISGTLDSSTFDTGVASGAQLNSVLWQGSMPAGTAVRFQFAVSNASSGPWNFWGTDQTSSTYVNTIGPGISASLNYSLFSNFRYFRYRITLYSDSAKILTPQVDKVIVNWSP